MARKLMVVSFHYPPVQGSSGIQRILKFTTYLRERGWEPMVLTISATAYERVSEDQVKEIPSNLKVVRAFGLNTAHHFSWRGRYLGWFAQPDRWVSWWPAAVWSGLRMIWSQRPVAIMSSYPIATAHLIALTLHRMSGLPWIADCRDSMTEPGYPKDRTTWRTNRWLEQAVVKYATRVVFTTEGTRKMYAQRYPLIPESRWAVIENGFDEENFRTAEHEFKPEKLADSPRILLLHSGILYPQERDPKPFFNALQSLKLNASVSASRLRIILRASGSENEYQRLLSDRKIEDLVHLEPPIGYIDALREMMCADGLLIFQAGMCNHQIPAKIYEYLRAGKPILALVDPQGNTADLLRTTGGAIIADITDAKAIEKGICQFIDGIDNASLKGVSALLAKNFSRRSRTYELAKLLDTVSVTRE